MSTDEAEFANVDGRWKWWAAASAGQIAIGTAWCRRGYTGNGTSMPLKAFAAASIFVGAGASAFNSVLYASGFHSMDNVKDGGRSIRRWIRAPPKETAN